MKWKLADIYSSICVYLTVKITLEFNYKYTFIYLKDNVVILKGYFKTKYSFTNKQ